MIRLILAETQAMVRQGLASLLERHPDVEILAAVDNADEAIAQIHKWQPDIAILAPPPSDKRTFPTIVESALSTIDTRMVWLSAHEDPREAAEAERLGVSAILTKENTFEDLLSALVVVFHGGTYMPPSLRDKVRAATDGANGKALSPREREVLQGITTGLTNKQIARAMDLSPKTVETYRNRLMKKLGLRCIADLVRYAVQNSLD